MNHKLFEKRINDFYQNFDNNGDRIKALREVMAETPQGRIYRRTLCKGFPNDAATNEAIADVCDQQISRLLAFKQLTIFNALSELKEIQSPLTKWDEEVQT